VNWLTSSTNDQIVLGFRLINHCRVAPVRVAPKRLHIQTSWYWWEIEAVNIDYLYWATCSTGFVIPEYFGVNEGMLYSFGTSIKVISSANENAWNPVRGSTSIGVAAAGSFARSDKTRSFCSSNNLSRWATRSFSWAASASCCAELAASSLIYTNCVCTVGVGTCVGGTYKTR